MNEEASDAKRAASADDQRRPLSEAERNRIFDEDILPSILTGDRPASNKTFVAVCSQPGGGKSTLVRSLKDRFGGERTISISTDDFYNHLPGVNEARMQGAEWGQELEHEEKAINEWFRKAEDYACENKVHLILETVSNPQEWAKSYKQDFKRAELYIIATDKNTSLTSIFSRAVRGFDRGSMANCAILDKETHDVCYATLPKIAFDVEAGDGFDKIGIATRDLGVCYENEIILGPRGDAIGYSRKPEAHRKFIELNNNGFTQEKVDQLKMGWNDVLKSPLACLPELKWYPLKEYQAAVMSHVESLGAQFHPKDVTPKKEEDLTAGRTGYLSLLSDEIALVSQNLDRTNKSDSLLLTDLGQMYADAEQNTLKKVEIGAARKKDTDRDVTRQNAQEATSRNRRLSSGDSVIVSGYGSSGSKSDTTSRLAQAGRDQKLRKRLRSADGTQQDLPEAASRQLAAEALLDLGIGREPKRGRYDDRNHDRGGRV